MIVQVKTITSVYQNAEHSIRYNIDLVDNTNGYVLDFIPRVGQLVRAKISGQNRGLLTKII